MAQGNRVLEKANVVMDRFYSDPEARRQYEAAIKNERDYRLLVKEFEQRGIEKGRVEGRAEGIAEGRAEGIVEGRVEAMYQNAKQMLEDNVPMELIVKYTGLKKEEVERL